MNILVYSQSAEIYCQALNELDYEALPLWENDLIPNVAKHDPPEIIIYDLRDEPVMPHEEVFKHISEYRIIIIAKREDPLIPYLAGLGVRDFLFIPINPEDIVYRVENPTTPAEAAETLKTIPNLQPDRIVEIEKETVIVEKPSTRTIELNHQRPKLLGLTTIAIAGAGSGVGVSHLSLAIATHLAKYNNQVVLAEWAINNEKEIYSQYKYLSNLGASTKIRKVNGVEVEIAKYNGFDIFLDARSFRSTDYVFSFVKKYNYLVLDLGSITPEKIAEMDRAALAVLVVNASPYRLEKFLPLIDDNEIGIYTSNLNKWKIALNLANEKENKWFVGTFKKILGEIHYVPYLPKFNEEVEIIKNILEPVLPSNQPRRKRPFWKFK